MHVRIIVFSMLLLCSGTNMMGAAQENISKISRQEAQDLADKKANLQIKGSGKVIGGLVATVFSFVALRLTLEGRSTEGAVLSFAGCAAGLSLMWSGYKDHVRADSVKVVVQG